MAASQVGRPGRSPGRVGSSCEISLPAGHRFSTGSRPSGSRAHGGPAEGSLSVGARQIGCPKGADGSPRTGKDGRHDIACPPRGVLPACSASSRTLTTWSTAHPRPWLAGPRAASRSAICCSPAARPACPTLPNRRQTARLRVAEQQAACVIVGVNHLTVLEHPDVVALSPTAEIYHVTLTPSIDTVPSRCAGTPPTD